MAEPFAPSDAFGAGINPSSGGDAQFNDFIAVLRSCIGAPYRYWNDGGDGKHNTSVSDVKRTGESCTGIFVFAFLQLGLDPPFSGTYDAKQNIGDSAPYDSSKTYPPGTFVVGVDAGTEGHIVMVSGSNNTIFESSYNDGVNEGKSLDDVVGSSYDMSNPVSGTYKVLGTGGATPIGGAAQSATSAFAGMGEEIAMGVAKALIRFIRALYCLTILWPIDWVSGYYWELTKTLAGSWAEWTENVDILGVLKGDTSAETAKFPPIKNSDPFSEENVTRFWWLTFLILTYVLAFGTDRNNQSHIDNMFNRADSMGVGINKGKKGYNEEAVITATTSRKSGENGASNGAAIVGSGLSSGAGTGANNNKVSKVSKRGENYDRATGRFAARKAGEETT